MKLRNKIYLRGSLFRKYLNVSVIIIILSFVVLGAILMFTVIQYWENTKKYELEKNTTAVSEYIGENILVRFGVTDDTVTMYCENTKQLESSLSILAQSVYGDIFITDMSGNVVMCSNDSETVSKSVTIPQKIIDEITFSHYYFEQDTLDGIYETSMYISARPIYYSNTSTLVGIVFVTSNVSQISAFTEILLRVFALAAIAALAVSLLTIVAFSYNMVKPLRQMADAARKFGKGDFSVRVSESYNDEIGALAVAFNNMADSLAGSENVRKSFVANVSHELKTPMTTIAGFIDGILDGTIPPEKQKHYLSIVSDEVRRLSRLVRSMLDLSRIDSGEMRLNYQTFDIVSTLVTILLTFEQEIEKRHLEIRGLDETGSASVYGDPDLIHQVIYNLVENAVKFTDENGYIEFQIGEWADRTTFSIKNSGRGVDSKELSLIFDRFYKTDKSRSEDKKGLGLGLYLVKTIIRLHGGEITADSEMNQYCRFSFFIPKKDSDRHKKQKG